MSGAGIKRDFWSPHTATARTNPIFDDIYQITDKNWAPWPFWCPLWPIGEHDQASWPIWPKGFHRAFESWKMGPCFLVLVVSGAHIPHTSTSCADEPEINMVLMNTYFSCGGEGSRNKNACRDESVAGGDEATEAGENTTIMLWLVIINISPPVKVESWHK